MFRHPPSLDFGLMFRTKVVRWMFFVSPSWRPNPLRMFAKPPTPFHGRPKEGKKSPLLHPINPSLSLVAASAAKTPAAGHARCPLVEMPPSRLQRAGSCAGKLQLEIPSPGGNADSKVGNAKNPDSFPLQIHWSQNITV